MTMIYSFFISTMSKKFVFTLDLLNSSYIFDRFYEFLNILKYVSFMDRTLLFLE